MNKTFISNLSISYIYLSYPICIVHKYSKKIVVTLDGPTKGFIEVFESTQDVKLLLRLDGSQ